MTQSHTHGDTVLHFTPNRTWAHFVHTRSDTVSQTMTGHLTRRPSGPPDLEFSSTPPSGSVPPSVRSVGGGRKPSAPRAGAGTRSRKSLIRGFTKGPPRSGGQRASAAVPAGKWSSRPGAAHPGTASKAYLDASGHLPLGCLCRDTKSPGLPNWNEDRSTLSGRPTLAALPSSAQAWARVEGGRLRTRFARAGVGPAFLVTLGIQRLLCAKHRCGRWEHNCEHSEISPCRYLTFNCQRNSTEKKKTTDAYSEVIRV